MLQVESVLAVLNDDRMDKSVNEKLGIVNYSSTPWELVEKKSGVQRREISYNLNKKLSQFGSKVSCIQQQTASDDKKKLTIDEILTLHDVPFGDHFQVSPLFLNYHRHYLRLIVVIDEGLIFLDCPRPNIRDVFVALKEISPFKDMIDM